MQIMTDSPIRFPGLFGDWAFTASSKALDIGNGIYWYGILIALGLVIAIWWCMNQKSKYGITEDDLLDSVLWGIPCAIVGARIYYVLFYLDQFKNSDGSFSFRKAIAIWDGGLAIYGAVIAVVIVGICVSRHRGYKLGAMLDLAVMGLLIGQCIGRWGNFMNREAFGAETTLPWRMQLTTVTGQLVEVQVHLGRSSQRQEGEAYILTQEIESVVLYETDEGLASARQKSQVQHRITGEGPGRCQFTAELLRDPAAAPVGEGIEVTALLSFRWRILEESETAVIQQVLLGEPRQADPNEPSVILRAVHPGEDLWAVAKAYHTTDEAILAASGLDSEEIYPGQRLLIPRTAG